MSNSFIFLTFSWGTAYTHTKKIGNKLIVFEIANKTNEIMSSVLSNILGWPGGNSSKQVRLYSHAHFETWLCHTGSTNTFDKSQTSIQHNYPCDFMNMKENILFIFLRNEWTTTGEVDKTDRTELGKCIHLYDVTLGNNETQALSTENRLRQMQEK